MARPTKNEERLTEPFSFRLTKTEAQPLRDKIAQSGVSQTDFLRDYVLKNRTTVIARPKASLEKTRMQFVFNKAGNNLNQLAHVLNRANLAGKMNDATCKQALATLEQISQYLRAALNHVD
jgi:hypothetical protein